MWMWNAAKMCAIFLGAANFAYAVWEYSYAPAIDELSICSHVHGSILYPIFIPQTFILFWNENNNAFESRQSVQDSGIFWSRLTIFPSRSFAPTRSQVFQNFTCVGLGSIVWILKISILLFASCSGYLFHLILNARWTTRIPCGNVFCLISQTNKIATFLRKNGFDIIQLYSFEWKSCAIRSFRIWSAAVLHQGWRHKRFLMTLWNW